MKAPQPSIPKYLAGIGLVELMIAITIGMVLVAGAINIFSATHKAHATTQRLSRLMENGLFALDTLSRNIEMAGYLGAASDPKTVSTSMTVEVTGDCATDWYKNIEQPVEAFDQINPYRDTCIPADRYAEGTDILVIRGTDTDPVANRNADTLYIGAKLGSGELVKGKVELSASTAGVINSSSSSNSIEYLRLRAMAFYVAPYYLLAQDGIPSLRRVELGPGPELQRSVPPDDFDVIAPGVEDFQIQFGISGENTNGTNLGTATRYVNPNEVTDWSGVVSARIWVLMRSEDPEAGYVNSNTYVLPDGIADGNASDGVFTAPGDGFRRLLLTRTVLFKNTAFKRSSAEISQKI